MCDQITHLKEENYYLHTLVKDQQEVERTILQYEKNTYTDDLRLCEDYVCTNFLQVMWQATKWVMSSHQS